MNSLIFLEYKIMRDNIPDVIKLPVHSLITSTSAFGKYIMLFIIFALGIISLTKIYER
ncbi:protein of unknown function [Methanocaldococcus lauensis]|nr:protein of unknown function [Methanocaldococcus lauensis]